MAGGGSGAIARGPRGGRLRRRRDGATPVVGCSIVAVRGIAIGWPSTHVNTRKSSTNVPEWFKPILDKLDLPANPPSTEQLLRMSQSALDSGEALWDAH